MDLARILLNELSEYAVNWGEVFSIKHAIPCPGVYSQCIGNTPKVDLAYYYDGKFFICSNPLDIQKSLKIIDLGTQTSDIVVSSDYFGEGYWNPAVYRPSTGVLFIYLGHAESELVKKLVTLIKVRGGAITATLDSYKARISNPPFTINPSSSQDFNGSIQLGKENVSKPKESPSTDTWNSNKDSNSSYVSFLPSSNWDMSLNEVDHFRLIVKTNGVPGDIPVPRCYIPTEKKTSAESSQTSKTAPSSNNASFKQAQSLMNDFGLGLMQSLVQLPKLSTRSRAQFALFHPSKATYTIFTDILNTNIRKEIPFGDCNDVPVPADYSGNGIAQLANFRPSTGEWFVQQSLDVYSDCIIIESPDFLANHDIPLPYFFEGKSVPALWRPSTNQLIFCSKPKDVREGKLRHNSLKCFNVSTEDIPMIIPSNDNLSNICFAKENSKWIFNQIMEVESLETTTRQLQRQDTFSNDSNTTSQNRLSIAHSVGEGRNIDDTTSDTSISQSVPRTVIIQQISTNNFLSFDENEMKMKPIPIETGEISSFAFEWIDHLYFKHITTGKFLCTMGNKITLSDDTADVFSFANSLLRHEDGLYWEVNSQRNVLLSRVGSQFDIIEIDKLLK